jgi:hypothetical protein
MRGSRLDLEFLLRFCESHHVKEVIIFINFFFRDKFRIFEYLRSFLDNQFQDFQD